MGSCLRFSISIHNFKHSITSSFYFPCSFSRHEVDVFDFLTMFHFFQTSGRKKWNIFWNKPMIKRTTKTELCPLKEQRTVIPLMADCFPVSQTVHRKTVWIWNRFKQHFFFLALESYCQMLQWPQWFILQKTQNLLCSNLSYFSFCGATIQRVLQTLSLSLIILATKCQAILFEVQGFMHAMYTPALWPWSWATFNQRSRTRF